MSVISFIVPGSPIPWARAREHNGRRFNDPAVEAYKALVRAHALRARQVALTKAGIVWPLDAIYQLTCVCERRDWRRMDADRVLNACADALVGVLYEDDRHAFLRDARVLVADPSDAPRLGVIVRVRDKEYHRALVRDAWTEIEPLLCAHGHAADCQVCL